MSIKSPDIGVAVVQWNHSALTMSLLDDLADCKANLRIAICDNGSEVAQRSALSGYLSERTAKNKDGWRIRLLLNKNNSGFARGANACVKALLDTGCEWIWLLNNDTRVPESASVDLVQQLVKSKPGIYGVSLHHKKSGMIAGGYRYGVWSTRNYPLASQQEFNETENLSKFVSGASMVVHRDVFEQVGLLNDSHFLYFEELDLVYRANKAGYVQKLLQGVAVTHEGEGSSGDPAQSKTVIYNETWSMLNFYFQHKKLLLIWIVLVRNPIRIIRLLTTQRAHCVSSVIRAMIDFSINRHADIQPVLITETVDYGAAQPDSRPA